MIRPLAQTRALAILSLRWFTRAAVLSRGGAGKRWSNLALRLFLLAMYVRFGSAGAAACLRVEGSSVTSTAWLLAGLFAYGLGFGAWRSGPTLRGTPSALASPLLDTLPLSQRARIAVFVFAAFDAHAVALGAFMAFGADDRSALLRIVSALAWSCTALLAGVAVARPLRAIVSPVAVVRTTWIGFTIQISGLWITFSGAPILGGWAKRGPWLLDALSEALVHGGSIGAMFAVLLGISIAASALIAAVERVGYDRLEPVPVRRLGKVAGDLLTIAGIDGVLAARESGRIAQRLALVYQLLIVAGLLSMVPFDVPVVAQSLLFRSGLFVIAFLASSAAMGRAARAAERDAGARPMLAALPIEPRALLVGRSRGIRRSAIIAPSAILLLAFEPGIFSRWEVLWRAVSAVAAVWLYADSAVAISFLTRGVGVARTGTSRISLENLLLLVPLIGVIAAPYPFAAIVSLGCLALATAEARRAGAGCVRWLDDADDTAEDGTVWRALIVFATFNAAQGLVAQLLDLPGTSVDPSLRIGLAYAASAVVLLLLTAQAERRSIRVWPAHLTALPLGALLGMLTGVAGFAYLALLRVLHVDVPSAPADASVTTRVVLAATIVLVAPIAEEAFFRGWLQNAIDRHRSNGKPWVAPIVTAFAFAAIHPPLSFTPVLLLGLSTGFLFARTRAIAPGIAAHIVHNAVALAIGAYQASHP